MSLRQHCHGPSRYAAPLLLCAGAALFLALPPLAASEADDLCAEGLALKRLGQLDGAAEAFRQAVKVDTDSVRAHWGLAWVYAAQSAREEAVAEFRRVLELRGKGEMARQAEAALARLGAPRTPASPTPGPATAPPPEEDALTVARRLLAAGEAFEATRLLRRVPEDDGAYAEAQQILAEAKRGRRVVKLLAAVDQRLRAHPGWETRVRDRVAFAAGEVGRQVEIDLRLLGTVEWNRSLSLSDGLALLDELQEEVPRDEAHAVVGFVEAAGEVRESDGRLVLHSEEALGLSPCFSGYGLVSEVFASHNGQSLRVPEAVLGEHLVHELGHLFGAVHVRGRSVMRPQVGQEPIYTLDPANLSVVRACRWVDFERNVASLSEEELAAMAEGYSEIAAGEAADDGVYFYRALVSTQLRRYDQAVADYEQVLKAWPADAFTHYNLAELYREAATRDRPRHDVLVEQARAHYKLAMTIGRPKWVAALAGQALVQVEAEP